MFDFLNYFFEHFSTKMFDCLTMFGEFFSKNARFFKCSIFQKLSELLAIEEAFLVEKVRFSRIRYFVT